MIRRFDVLFVAAFCAIGCAEVAPAPGTQDVQTLFNQSDLVCSCLVESSEVLNTEWVESGGSRILRRHALARVRAIQIFKSSPPSPSRLSIAYDDDRLSEGETAVMFLKSAGSSAYGLADPFLGATPFSGVPVVSGDTGQTKLESALADVAHHTNRGDQINAMKLLQGFRRLSQPTIGQMGGLSDSSDPEIAFAAFAVLLKAGNNQDLYRFCAYLRNHSTESAPISIVSIGSELGQVHDGRAISSLEELSGSKLLSVRIGSMQALRSIRSPKEAPAVIKRLDDPDGYVSYLAVMTLAETFDKYGDYAPNMRLFDGNPGFYLGLWKSWWATEGQAYRPLPK